MLRSPLQVNKFILLSVCFSFVKLSFYWSSVQELCLHTKLLSGPGTSIAEFLSRAPEPPPYLVLRNAVETLKVGYVNTSCSSFTIVPFILLTCIYSKGMDALDQWEDLTELGWYMAFLFIVPS